jgi:hypothetical protein
MLESPGASRRVLCALIVHSGGPGQHLLSSVWLGALIVLLVDELPGNVG